MSRNRREVCKVESRKVEGRVLVVEDDAGNRALLREHMEAIDIAVTEAETGAAGIDLAARLLPQGVVISTTLPDMPGAQVVARLRGHSRTRHIYLLLLADRNERGERLSGLEVGANDFVPSPYDPDELALRVRNALRRANTSNRTDPVTGLPAGELIQDQLRQLLKAPEGSWALLRVRVLYINPFRELHGFMAAEELLRGVAHLLAEALSRDTVKDDFLGYGGKDDFIVVTEQDRVPELETEVLRQFEQEVGSHYDFRERERGYIVIGEEKVPLARLRFQRVTPADGPFYDIRSLSEALVG